MRKMIPFLLLAILLTIPTTSSFAQLTSIDAEEVNFTKKDFKDQVWYSSAFTLTDEGLVYQPAEGQTGKLLRVQSQPIPSPSAIRPPASVSLWMDITSNVPNEKLKTVWFRYSSDLRHWSEWRLFSEEVESIASLKGRHGLAVSKDDSRDRFLGFRNQWINTNPEDVNDENECSHWIVRQDPTFFEKEKPFVGYIQYLIDFPEDAGPIRIQRIKLSTMSTVSGLFSGTIVTEKPQKGRKPKVISDNTAKIFSQNFAKWSFDYDEAVNKAATPATEP